MRSSDRRGRNFTYQMLEGVCVMSLHSTCMPEWRLKIAGAGDTEVAYLPSMDNLPYI